MSPIGCHFHLNRRKEKQIMRESQFIGIFFGILIIMLTTEIGFITICSYLKEIKQLLEKYINQEPPKGE